MSNFYLPLGLDPNFLINNNLVAIPLVTFCEDGRMIKDPMGKGPSTL